MENVTHTAKFITVEGGEGVGKTTQLRLIEARLREAGIPLLVTREPGGTELGEQLRQLLLQKEGLAPTPMAELLMVFAARAQHVDTVIAPALQRGEWVLCDRFTDASFAYQGFGRGLPLGAIQQLAELAHPHINPNLSILLDVDPEVGLERARARGELDRFELETIPFFEAVRNGYLQRVKLEPHRWRVIDAGVALEQVEQQLGDCLKEWIADAIS
ncbi:Thymidylate kinase [marine gamma proteobacterium HTCC2080]|nr:Thymidylate kinase [marine gamma proteobacterium HTCC2080]